MRAVALTRISSSSRIGSSLADWVHLLLESASGLELCGRQTHRLLCHWIVRSIYPRVKHLLLPVCVRVALNSARIHAGLAEILLLGYVLPHPVVWGGHLMLRMHALLREGAGWNSRRRGLNSSTALPATPLVRMGLFARNNIN